MAMAQVGIAVGQTTPLAALLLNDFVQSFNLYLLPGMHRSLMNISLYIYLVY